MTMKQLNTSLIIPITVLIIIIILSVLAPSEEPDPLKVEYCKSKGLTFVEDTGTSFVCKDTVMHWEWDIPVAYHNITGKWS